MDQFPPTGRGPHSVSASRTQDTHDELVAQIKRLVADLDAKTEIYDRRWTTYDECLERVLLFKGCVENQEGYRILNRPGETPFKETDVGLFFGFTWCRTEFDVNRETNNGRGPVDFKASYGAKDTSLIEFKLASNRALKRNLENQGAVYEKANRAGAQSRSSTATPPQSRPRSPGSCGPSSSRATRRSSSSTRGPTTSPPRRKHRSAPTTTYTSERCHRRARRTPNTTQRPLRRDPRIDTAATSREHRKKCGGVREGRVQEERAIGRGRRARAVEGRPDGYALGHNPLSVIGQELLAKTLNGPAGRSEPV